LKQATHILKVRTPGPGLIEITRDVQLWIRGQGIHTGLLTVFIQHTSASLTIQENADPDVIADLNDHFARLAPPDRRLYRHTMEGPDDMPAHIRTVLSGVQLSVPILHQEAALGTWQGIYVFEHRARPHTRSVVLHALGCGSGV
jgi:secondary thiamine-phosphate synthase enzyme